MLADLPPLTDDERARYEWQMWTPEYGEQGQQRLKNSAVLVSRLGGVGGTVAYYLAAAGVGKLVVAHGGNVKPSDLNRQLLMTTDWLGKPRVESAKRRLQELNPNVQIDAIPENMSAENAAELVSRVDVIVDGAPLFEERYAMNEAAVTQGKPLIECAMFDMDAQLTTIIPGQTPCLKCLYPEHPPHWKREFPVIGATSGTVASMAALEAIKIISGTRDTAAGRMIWMNLRTMNFRSLPVARRPDCPVCSGLTQAQS